MPIFSATPTMGSSMRSRVPTTRFDVDFDPEWAVDSVFGGAIVAAAATSAVTAAGDPTRIVVSAAVRFSRAIPPGPASLIVEVQKAGRSYTFASCDVETAAGHAASALLTLAPREHLPTIERCLDEPDLPDFGSADSPLGALSRRVDWRAETEWGAASEHPDVFCSWFRLRDRVESGDLEGPGRYLIAADLIGPAIAASGVPLPFRIATVSLEVSVIALTSSPWLKQIIRVHRSGESWVGVLELRTARGELVAVATQRAMVLPATDSEMPWSVTGFGWGRAR